MIQEKDLPLVDMYFMNENYQAWQQHTIKHFEAEETMDTITARFFKSGMSPCSLQK